MITKRGVDLSHHQAGLILAKIAPQLDFVILRCSHGTTSVDETFQSFYDQARDLQIPTAAYCYCYYGDAVKHDKEVDNGLRQVQGKKISVFFVDYEEQNVKYNPPLGAMGKAKITEYLLRDYAKIKAAGFTPGIYANKNWLENYIDASKIPADMVVWLAQYAEKPTYAGRYDLWQFTSQGTLNGYAGPLDMNFWYVKEPVVTPTDVKSYSLASDGDKLVSDDCPNFKVREFACHDHSDKILISTNLVHVLQKIRAKFGKPVRINSAYRTASYNAEVGGAAASQHILGTAADITVDGIDLASIYLYAESLGVGGLGLYNSFVHVDVRDGYARWNESSKPTPAFRQKVRVTTAALRIRKGPGTSYAVNGFVLMGSTQILSGICGKWGKLANGKGWICLDYTKVI